MRFNSYSSVQKFVVSKILLCFKRRLSLFSPKLHLFDQKYSKSSSEILLKFKVTGFCLNIF